MRQKFNQMQFKGKKVLIRVDFNVPLDKETRIVKDLARIKATIPTISYILENGGAVILMSHLGRPKQKNKGDSLIHLLPNLKSLFPDKKLLFIEDCIGPRVKEAAENLKMGEILLLENLRFYKEEEEGNLEFAKQLASIGDIYINDAFGSAHRAHASTSVIAQFFRSENKNFGFLMDAEITQANRLLMSAQEPFTAILGGAKITDKIKLIENLLPRINKLIIGGGMAFSFIKADGGSIGKSLCDDEQIAMVKHLQTLIKNSQVKIYLPIDIVEADSFSNEAERKVVGAMQIDENWMGLDIGPKSCDYFSDIIKISKTILWNGPMGVFEMENFQEGTKAIAIAVGEATAKNSAFSLIGGGDSVSAINKFKLTDKVSYLSTGGGAMLEYLEGRELPGISAINK